MRNIRCWLGHNWSRWAKGQLDIARRKQQWTSDCARCGAQEIWEQSVEGDPNAVL